MDRFQVNNDIISMKNSCISQSKKKKKFTNFFDVWIYRRQLVSPIYLAFKQLRYCMVFL